jgi:Putative peptidoglycan binding domain
MCVTMQASRSSHCRESELATQISGLDRDMAALRFTIREDGLKLAPSIVEPIFVPHRVVIDFGVENLATAALNTMLRAASLTGSASEAEQQQANQQIIGSMATLNPVGKIYEIAIETQNVGAALTAEAKGTPLSPTGYAAEGDLVVRGWDALAELAAGTPFLEYLPFLKEFTETVEAPDGSPRVKFHLASTPQKWAVVNGNDVSLWFDESEPSPNQPRLLKPAEPPMQGADVQDVQRALAAAKLTVEQDGLYRISTAIAVARFQRQKAMNISGVVDMPTRRALGLRLPGARPAGRN